MRPTGGRTTCSSITFDEGYPSDQRDQPRSSSRIDVTPGFRSVRAGTTHYSLLRTLEASWGLGCLGNACTASDLSEFFSPTGPLPSSSPSSSPEPSRSGDGPAAPGIQRRGP